MVAGFWFSARVWAAIKPFCRRIRAMTRTACATIWRKAEPRPSDPQTEIGGVEVATYAGPTGPDLHVAGAGKRTRQP